MGLGIEGKGGGGRGSGGEGRVMMVRSERECQRNKWTRKFWKCLIETAQGYYFSLFSNTLPLVKQTRVLEGGTPIQYPYVPGDRVWYFSEVPDPQTVSGFKTLRGLHLAAICVSTPGVWVRWWDESNLGSWPAMICWKIPTQAPLFPSQYSGLGSSLSNTSKALAA